MPTDEKARRSLAAWLVPAATFVAGAVAAFALLPGPTPAPPPPPVPLFGASAPATASAPAADTAMLRSELALMRQINDGFVDQLRRFETRLKDIATGAEEEGASEAAAAMRDFALETEILIDRFDLIVKKN